jgi:integrase
MFRSKTFEPTLIGLPYRIFIEGLKSPVTKAAYSYAFSKYMKHLKLDNPDDLLKNKDNPKFIQDQIIEYMIYLKNPPCSLRYATRSQYLAAIMTFYELNEVILNKKKIYRYLGEEERPIENRGYTSQEIAEMLEFCDERIRAIILFLASTGVRIRAIIDLKIEDLTNIPEYEIHQVRVYATAKERYFTFTTPEASKAITTYLNYRETCGERLKPSSPLFRNQFNRIDPDSVHNSQPIRLRALEWLISQTIQKSGLRTVERQTEIHESHGRIRKNVRLTAGFRKFFDTQLIYARVEPRTKEMFMGHSIGLDDHYFTPGENYILQEYLKAVDYLTINEENRLRKEVKELTSRQSEIKVIEEKREQEMKLMREEMKQQYNQIMSMIQQNPVLAFVKPETLSKKKIQ